MKINPITVDKLKDYDWYYSEDHNFWYYYKERKVSDYNYTELDETLDPGISKIVNFINSQGFKTLPSCEGHKRTFNFCKKAWKSLLSDQKKIRTTGLWLNNCENSNKYYLYDTNWELPFSYEEFRDICSGRYEVIGYVGFICDDEKIYNLLDGLFDNSAYVSVKFDGKVIEIFNNSKSDSTRKENWDLIYRVLREVL
jgi:hypothetical protein